MWYLLKIQPSLFLNAKKQPTVRSQDVFDTLMPLFQSGALDYGHVDQPSELQRTENFQHISSENAQNVHPNMVEHLQQNIVENEHEIQPTQDVHIEDLLHNECMSIKSAKTMPK